MADERKYKQGEQITSLDELAKQKFVYFHHEMYRVSWFMLWRFRAINNLLAKGLFYYAVAVEEGKDEE